MTGCADLARVELDYSRQPGRGLETAWRLLAADFGALAILGVLALGGGLFINALRPGSLPLRYDPAGARLQRAVASLSAGAPVGGPVEQISLETFQRAATQRTALILDARPDVFYHAGHVPGAVNLARESFAADYGRLRARLEASKDQPIIVYCADADCPDSGLVAAALQQLGFRHVTDFAAGWEGWTAAGLPEDQRTPP
jgi:rhodanese-related sulfurtransferase